MTRLIVLAGKNIGKGFELEPGSNLIGRWDPDTGSFPEVDLEEEDIDAKISRKHAVLTLEAGRAQISDVGSLNGTYLNSEKLESGLEYDIRSGDEVIIGKVRLRFER